MPSELRRARDQARTAARREALLDAAARVFVRHGYHRTLISDIASEAKVGQGTFYRHFQDKRAVFDALLDRFIAQVFESFSQMSSNPPQDGASYRAASAAAIRHVVRVMEDDRALAMLLLREAPTVDRELEEKITGVYATLAEIARSHLDRAVAAGYARPCRTAMVSQAIIGIGAWMSSAWWSGRLLEISADDLIEELVDFVFLGLSPQIEPAK
ncbi:MAG: TetR/AcrR family transcriptional regulator [Polyangia bacterium]|jgi:AcrR family transcriptional regulator|nr:TetR/AcrR family transcriptional regulator [Polyangia bacterium]